MVFRFCAFVQFLVRFFGFRSYNSVALSFGFVVSRGLRVFFNLVFGSRYMSRAIVFSVLRIWPIASSVFLVFAHIILWSCFSVSLSCAVCGFSLI